MITKIDGLSDNDKLLEEELNNCRDAYQCALIAEQAESDQLRMAANYKCIRLYRQEEYSVGSL